MRTFEQTGDNCVRSHGMRFRMIACWILSLLLAFGFALSSLLPHMTANMAFADETNQDDQATRVVIGYYTGDTNFQNGFSDEERKSGYAYDFFQELAPWTDWIYSYEYGTRSEIMDALQAGEIDIVAGVHRTDKLENEMLFSDQDLGLSGEPVYFAVNKNKPELLDQLNEAIKGALEINPNLKSDLWNTYYSTNNSIQALSNSEREYLDSKELLRFGCVKHNLPISGEDDEGQPAGIAAEIVPVLESFLKTPIEITMYDNTTIMKQALADGNVDFVFPVYSDPWISESNGIIQTDPIISDRVIIGYINEYNEDLLDKVAVSETSLGQQYFFETNLPKSQMIIYPTRKECLDAVQSGEAGCIVGAASVLQRFIMEQDVADTFNIAYLDGSEEFSIGVSANNSTLAGIMKKAALELDSSLINDSMVKYSYVKSELSLTNVLKQYAVGIILILAALLATGTIVFVRWRQRVRRFDEEQAKAHMALEEALSAANNASEAKTSFLSSMSHDIRTPMNGIIGMTAIAAANIDNRERVEDCLVKITSSSKHLLALINEILDVSKIESGKLELSEEPFNLSDMIDDLMIINRPLAEEKRQQINVHALDVKHEQVIGDSTRLQQVLTNLVNNAIKYTDVGGMINITLAERPSGNPKIGCFELIVEDNGIGISEEYLPHVFEAFTRSQGKTVAKIQGTGLGMPIARSITRMMNGDITVESKQGEGSTFTATVYLKLADFEEVSYEELVDLPVLVVDDEEAVCESTCALLDDLGMKPESTTSGIEAIEMVTSRNREGNDYYAIILDWVMPEIDGLSVIKAIRDQISEKIPIIVVSAYDWSEIEYEARTAGAVTFISKPLFKSRLISMFSELMGTDERGKHRGLNEITQTTSYEGRRTLLAEDNDLNAEIACEFLKMAGFEVERARDGQEAVDLVLEHEPGYFDCVFMDIQMPVKNGIEAALEIRGMAASNRPDCAELPIFAMTADAFVDDVKATADAGMNEHFAKPIDFEHVLEVIGKYF